MSESLRRNLVFWLLVALALGAIWMLLPPRRDDRRIVPEGHEMPTPDTPSEPISPF